MGKKRNATGREWIDPDDAPELTDEWFDTADYYEGDKLVRRGRPRSDSPKKAVSLRLDDRLGDGEHGETSLDVHGQPPEIWTRPCLRCRKPFESEGAHHRLCNACATADVSPYAL